MESWLTSTDLLDLRVSESMQILGNSMSSYSAWQVIISIGLVRIFTKLCGIFLGILSETEINLKLSSIKYFSHNEAKLI